MPASALVLVLLASSLPDGGQPPSASRLDHTELRGTPQLGDPSRAAGWLPGSRELLSGLAPISFDGLQPGATAVYFDGVPLRAPHHVFFGPSSISPFLIDAVEVSPGVEPAHRGRTIGRSLDLFAPSYATKLSTGVRFDLFQLGGYVAAPLGATGPRIQAAARFFTGAWLASKIVSGLKAELYDYQLRAEQPMGRGTLRLLVLGLGDAAGISQGGLPVRLGIQQHTADLAWRGGTEATQVELGVRGGLSRLAIATIGEQTSSGLDATERSAAVRISLEQRITSATRVRGGGDLELRQVQLAEAWTTAAPEVDGVTGEPIASRYVGAPDDTTLGGLWGEIQVQQGGALWTLGVRGDVWSPPSGVAFFTADPRVSVETRFSPRFTARLAAGVAHQAPTWLTAVPVLDTVGIGYGLQEVVRLEGEGHLQLTEHQQLSARVYGTALLRAIELSPLDDDFLQSVKGSIARHSSTGYTAGVDVWWMLLDTGRFSARAGYSFQQTVRETTFTRWNDQGLPSGQATAWLPTPWQQSHQVQAQGQWRPTETWQISLGATFHTGPPEAGQLYSTGQREGTDPLRPGPRWIPEDRDRVRAVGPWVRVDARVAKTFHPGPLALTVFLEVQNLSVWRQPTGSSYSTATSTLEQQAAGELTLVRGGASSPLPGPLPMLGLDLRL